MAEAATALKSEAHIEDTHTGLDAAYREKMTKALTAILAATYHLTIKSQVYHWNVAGPLFKPLHELTEAHYEALFKSADVIAERIRALGHLAPAELADASNFAPSGSDVDHHTAIGMVKDLIKDHAASTRAMRDAAKLAGDSEDVVTEDMLTQFLNFHEKALWMLRAIIAD